MKDKLLFLPKHTTMARRIFNKLEELDNVIISVGGKSGVGKTEVAIKLGELLLEKGIYSKVLSSDGFYWCDHEDERLDSNYTSVGKNEIDWVSLDHAVQNLHHTRAYNIVILEGLYACYYESDVRFYISQSYKDSYNFRVKRGKEQPDCPYRHKVLELEAVDVRKSKDHADFILTY